MAEMAAEMTDLGRCPFCGRKVNADIEKCMLLHDMPACKTFLESSVMEFLAKMKKAREMN